VAPLEEVKFRVASEAAKAFLLRIHHYNVGSDTPKLSATSLGRVPLPKNGTGGFQGSRNFARIQSASEITVCRSVASGAPADRVLSLLSVRAGL
jgi:hypothetical protein